MNSDSEEEAELPYAIGQVASQGDFERVKAWLAGQEERYGISASAPHSVNARDDDDCTLLHWTASGVQSPEHVEFARYLISQGARVDAKNSEGATALHFACSSITGEPAVAMVSLLVAAGATVNIGTHAGRRPGRTPLFFIYYCDESTIDIVTILLRAGASLDIRARSFEEHLNKFDESPFAEHYAEHVGPIRNLVASVRAAGSWKAHCRRPHKQVLRLRSLVARGRTKERLATTRAIRFIVRQGDNGIVWTILSYWREAG